MILHRVIISEWSALKQEPSQRQTAACQNSRMPGRPAEESAPDPEQLYLYQGGNEMKAESIFNAIRQLISSGFEVPIRLTHDVLESNAGVLRLIARETCELTPDGQLIELLHPTPSGAKTR